MDLSGLPTIRRRGQWPLFALHLVHASLASVIGWSLTLAGAVLVREETRSGEGLGYLLLLAVFMAFEAGLAVYLILRRRKLHQLINAARECLLAGDAVHARAALVGLLGFLEYRADPSAVYYGLAVADILDGERGRAASILKRAGSHAASLELRALLLLQDGVPHKAERLLTGAIALRPSAQRLWVTLAACVQAQRDIDRAVGILESAYRRWPKSFAIKKALQDLRDGTYLLNAILAHELPAAGKQRK